MAEVIVTQTVDDYLRRAFAPTTRGIVGLTEQLLEACVGSDVSIERVGDKCVCRWSAGGESQESAAPLPPAAFRTLLARIAALCNERRPKEPRHNILSKIGLDKWSVIRQ